MIRDSAIVSCNDALLVRRPNCLPYSFETQGRGGSEGIRCLTSSETSWDEADCSRETNPLRFASSSLTRH